MAFDPGEGVVLKSTFTDDNGDPASPTKPVEARVKRPDDEVDGPFTMTEQSTGVFTYTYEAPETGWYTWKATSSGSPPVIDQHSFEVIEDEAS